MHEFTSTYVQGITDRLVPNFQGTEAIQFDACNLVEHSSN